MKNRYSGPTLQLQYWCVTRNDIARIADFLGGKFNSRQIEIRLKTNSRKSKVYSNLKEFESDIEFLQSLNEEVETLEIEKTVIRKTTKESIWIEINFRFNFSNFNMFAEDETGNLRGWVQNTYDELQALVSSFRQDGNFEEILKRDFSVRYPDRRLTRGGIVIWDYDGNITTRIREELMFGKKHEGVKLAEDWFRDRRFILILVVLTILLLANIIRLIWFS